MTALPEPALAITRAVSPRLPECELTHLSRSPIDPERAAEQHHAYEEALRSAGLRVIRLESAPDHPDGVFVEDAAVILDEVAVITRPGAESRRGEIPSVRSALESYRPLLVVEAPATLDGGDVLVAGRTVFVGDSRRTGSAGHAWLRSALEPYGYEVRVVPVRGCLHLKTAVTAPAPDVFLVNPAWVPADAFPGEVLRVDPGEPLAANVLRVGDRVICAAGAPRTRRVLQEIGLQVLSVDVSELAKAEAGVTCCSLVVTPGMRGEQHERSGSGPDRTGRA